MSDVEFASYAENNIPYVVKKQYKERYEVIESKDLVINAENNQISNTKLIGINQARPFSNEGKNMEMYCFKNMF